MERFSKRKSLVEKIIGFAFLSSYLLLRIKLNTGDPRMILGQIRSGLEDEILAPSPQPGQKSIGRGDCWRRIGEERGGWNRAYRNEKPQRAVPVVCSSATTITREGSRGNFGRGGNSHPLRIGHWWTWGWKREAIQGGLIKAELEKCRGTFLYRLYRTFEIVDALGRGF